MEHSNFRLTDNEKNMIIYWHQEGESYDTIIEKFFSKFKKAVSKGEISKLIQKYNTSGTIENLSSAGRPVVYSDRYKRELARTALTNANQSLRDIEESKTLNPEGASKDTIRRCLIDHNIKTIVRPKRLDIMTKEDMKNRKKWAEEHLFWTIDDWKLGIFADEPDLFPVHSGKEFIRVKENQTVADVATETGWKQKKLTIKKVWGAISFWGVGPLVRITGTMDRVEYMKILQGYLEPIIPDLKKAAIADCGHYVQLRFLDDNSGYHRVPEVVTWKTKMRFSSMTWPSYSPDINIIENMWSYLQDKLYDFKSKLNNANEVWECTQEIWNNIDRAYIRTLYESLPNRMDSIVRNKGGPIDY